MKGEGSTSSIQGIQSSAAIAIAALLSVLFLLTLASSAHADTLPCGNPSAMATGYFFSDYESDEYVDGLLVRHFKINPPYTEGRTFKLTWYYFDDACNNAFNFYGSNTLNVTMPAGITDWSIRYATPAHFDVWDDIHNTIIAQADVGAFPSYTSAQFLGSIDGGASFLTSRTLKIQEDGQPPVFTGTLAKDPNCPSMIATGYYFDPTFEHAEYVDHLLRVHLRVLSPYNDGRLIWMQMLSVDASCNRDASIPWLFSMPRAVIPAHIRYFSFRMTSPTHWVLWNDENDTQIICSFGALGCEGDIAEGTPYVSLYGNIDQNATTLFTTPYAPVEVQQGCTVNCNSNVLFIPGIKAVELYEGNSKRWLPGLFNFDGQRLAMNESSESINNITVGNPIEKAYGVLEIYDTFTDFMEKLKSENLINDWQSAPYDWRYDVYDVVSHDQQLQDGSVRNLVDQVRALAATSKTGKVTIIAHSNGGLVGKALIDALGDDADLVDRFIMVGTPQLGTPSAVAAMLHGIGQGLPLDSVPFAMTKATSRAVSKNMPGAYGLLPLSDYFDVVSDPVVEFADSVYTTSYRNAYGDSIDSANELFSFLLGVGDARTDPDYGDTEKPIVLNEALLSDSLLSRGRLEGWTPPAGIEVVQIAGWGLDTLRGFRYHERDCALFELCDTFLDIAPLVTVEGDQTVVSPSASAMNTETYYFNLAAFNHENDTTWTHANILAAISVQDLIKDIITDSTRDASYITSAKPEASDAGKRFHVSVHSPITIGIRDARGRFTGVIPNPDPSSDIPVVIQEIPNTYYFEFGDGKYVGFEANQTYDMVMQGTDSGTFTLEIEEIVNDQLAGSITYSDVPVSSSTVASLSIRDLESMDALKVDINGDGTADEAIVPDEEKVSLDDLISTIKEKIPSLSTTGKYKQKLLKSMSNLEKKIENRKQKNGKILESLKWKVSKQEARGKIASVDAEEIIMLVDFLETRSDVVSFDPAVINLLKERIRSLDIKESLKNDLARRLDRLERKHAVVRALDALMSNISKKATKGQITDTDAQMLITLLEQMENAL